MTRTRWLLLILAVVVGALAFDSFRIFQFATQVGGEQRQALVLAQQLQQQRIDSLSRQCQDQNRRHNETISELDRLLAMAARKATPAVRAQLRDSRAFTVLLIDRLAPAQDCRAVVRVATHNRSPTRPSRR